MNPVNNLEKELFKETNQSSGINTGSLVRTFMRHPEHYDIALVQDFSLRNASGNHTVSGCPVYATESLRVLKGSNPVSFPEIGKTTGYAFVREGGDMVTLVYVKDSSEVQE